jgi:hypothetical protein
VNTQLPYAFVCSAASAVGYVALGLTGNTIVGLLVAVATLAVAVAVLRTRYAVSDVHAPTPVTVTGDASKLQHP